MKEGAESAEGGKGLTTCRIFSQSSRELCTSAAKWCGESFLNFLQYLTSGGFGPQTTAASWAACDVFTGEATRLCGPQAVSGAMHLVKSIQFRKGKRVVRHPGWPFPRTEPHPLSRRQSRSSLLTPRMLWYQEPCVETGSRGWRGIRGKLGKV